MRSTTQVGWFGIVMFLGVLAVAPPGHAGTSDDQTSMADVRKQTQELLQTLKAYTADQRDEAVQKSKAALDDLDHRIDALDAQIHADWDKMDKAAREKARRNLDALREQRARVAEWYGKMKNSSGDAWEDMKKGFSDAYQSLDEAWEKAEKEYHSKP